MGEPTTAPVYPLTCEDVEKVLLRVAVLLHPYQEGGDLSLEEYNWLMEEINLFAKQAYDASRRPPPHISRSQNYTHQNVVNYFQKLVFGRLRMLMS